MTKITCTRKLSCDMGHRVYGHENLCKHAHGHRFDFLVTAEAPAQDSVGRIIDFSVLKNCVGGWIDKHWDHAFCLWDKDPAVKVMQAFPIDGKTDSQRLFLLPYNPTAENLAKYLLEVVCPEVLAKHNVTVTVVEVWETPNGKATAST